VFYSVLINVPLSRKIIGIGKTSRAIILPKSWLDWHEQRIGPINKVAIEVNSELRIKPLEENKKNG
jgi:hypothetical protein